MKTLLKNFLTQFEELSPDAIAILIERMELQKFEKGTILVHEGEVCDACFFVLKGCLREYINVNTVEKTTSFYLENEAAVLFDPHSNKKASNSFLVCLEDSVLLVGRPELDAELFKEFPVLEKISRKMMDINHGKLQKDFAQFMISSPEKRYLNLLQNNPLLLQRIPQHLLASYIGVTPESFSRIRKRIFIQKR